MTDEARLAAALALIEDGEQRRAVAQALADPTLICPDPDAHALAEAVRRLPLGAHLFMADYGRGPGWVVKAPGRSVGHAPTLEAAIAAALEDPREQGASGDPGRVEGYDG